MNDQTSGIYIRTSSERQAEKASPQAQEDDCRAYYEDQGFQVVEVYRDTEKYKSRTRRDRPRGRTHQGTT